MIAEQLSLAGLTNMAFGKGKNGSPSMTISPGSGNDSRSRFDDEDYFTRLPRRETRRVRISAQILESGFELHTKLQTAGGLHDTLTIPKSLYQQGVTF